MNKMNISQEANRRVQHPVKVPKKCPVCSSKVILQHGEDIFGRSVGGWPWYYICTNCDCRVGTHPGTKIPMGTLADQATRRARQQAKATFLHWAKRNNLSQTRRYELLSSLIDVRLTKCHFAMFDLGTCEKVTELLSTHRCH